MGVPGRRLVWLQLKRSVRIGESGAATTPDDPLESKNNRAALRNHWRDSATRPGSHNDFNRLALLAFRRLLGLALFRRGFFLRFCFHLFLGHRLFLGLLFLCSLLVVVLRRVPRLCLPLRPARSFSAAFFRASCCLSRSLPCSLA